MNTPGVDKVLQAAIRRVMAEYDWPWVADRLGCTLKSVQYALNPLSPREVTYHFIGLLAVKLPDTWQLICEEMAT